MIEATGDPRSGVMGKQKRHDLIANLYRAAGAGDSTQFAIFDEPHGYGEAIRRGAYRWLSRWLRGADPAPETLAEEPIALEPESALMCTFTGQVRTALGGETVFSLNRAEAARIRDRQPLPRGREAWPEWRRRLRADVASRLAFSASESALNARTLEREDRGSYILEKTIYYSEPDIYVPGLLLLPKGGGARAGVVFVNDGGKTAGGVVESYLRPLAESGAAVFAIDPRGTGETAPAASSRETSYRAFTSDEESRLAYDSLAAGATLAGMRTRDVLRAVDYLRTRPEIDAQRISVAGRGSGGLLALHAAALDDRIRSAAVTGTLAAYAAIVENEMYKHPYSTFVPGALSKYDLPELAAAIAPRPLLLINAVDETQTPLGVERAAEIYRPAKEVYGVLGAPGALRIEHASSAGDIVEMHRALLLGSRRQP
jgi:dienelactone hydrolase